MNKDLKYLIKVWIFIIAVIAVCIIMDNIIFHGAILHSYFKWLGWV
jgi:hypothetical protein